MSLPFVTEDIQLGAKDGVSLEVWPLNMIIGSQGDHVLREMLSNERQCLSRLDAEINHLESILEDLRKQRNTCVVRMNRFSVTLSPHKLLPPEILAEIFVHSMCDQPTALQLRTNSLPWIFLRVCSRWRQVALAEHRLWDRLDVVGLQADLVGSLATAWIPHLWGRTQIFPLSLSLVAFDKDLALRHILSPYSQRLRSLSLNISSDSLSSFLIAPPMPFDCLNSVVLNLSFGIPLNMRLQHSVDGPPISAFTASPTLRKVTFISDTMNAIEFHTMSCLPWSQLAHVTLRMIRISLGTLECILRQCAKLVSLTFTSLNTEYEPSMLTSIPEIHLPELQSITLISDNATSASSIFELLRVPLLEEFTLEYMDRRYYGSQALWNRSQFIRMLDRSGCRLRHLNLSSRLGGIDLERLLPELPHLVKLVVSNPNPIPSSIFDMMIRGDVLQKLEHLECFTLSPIHFLRLVEYQCEFMTSGELRGVSSAIVSYREPEMMQGISELSELLDKLKPNLEKGEKAIVLNKIENKAE